VSSYSRTIFCVFVVSDPSFAPEKSPEDVAFGQSIKDWPVFPDTIAALEKLSKHYKLVVLSNVDKVKHLSM
jgi:FMN phosphatase YigB (HAD superfamily)